MAGGGDITGLGGAAVRNARLLGSGRWVAPFDLGMATSTREAERLLRRSIARVKNDDLESLRARQVMRALLDELAAGEERPLTVDDALRLAQAGGQAVRVSMRANSHHS